MDTKGTLERACLRLEAKYQVPDDFKVRIREILEPLFRHDLSADEMVVIERALERTYVRHSSPEADTPSGVAEILLGEGGDFGHTVPATESLPRAAVTDGGLEATLQGGAAPRAGEAQGAQEPSQPRAVPTGIPSAGGGKGGVLLVKIDPKTKTAQLIRLSADQVKVLANKAAISDFLKEPDDEDTVVH